MNAYLRTKILHLWLVVGWMATVLGLPLLLECAAAAEGDPARSRLLERGRGPCHLAGAGQAALSPGFAAQPVG